MDGVNADQKGGTGADAELLAAYEDWLQAYRELMRCEFEEGEVHKPFTERLNEAAGRLLPLPALTPKGVTAKLRWLMIQSR